MSRSNVTKSGKTQIIRLPEAVAFPDHVKTVEIVAEDNARVIRPAGGTWAEFFAGPLIDDDFLSEWNKPKSTISERNVIRLGFAWTLAADVCHDTTCSIEKLIKGEHLWCPDVLPEQLKRGDLIGITN